MNDPKSTQTNPLIPPLKTTTTNKRKTNKQTKKHSQERKFSRGVTVKSEENLRSIDDCSIRHVVFWTILRMIMAKKELSQEPKFSGARLSLDKFFKFP